MYFGGTDSRALHQLVWEVLDNSIEQVKYGPCNCIEVALDRENTLSVSDNGAGIPIENYQDTGRSILEIIMTEVGGKNLDREKGTFLGGSFGVGLAAVNAVSTTLSAQVKRDGYLWQQTYNQGIKQSELEQVRPLAEGEQTGTSVTFKPDFTVFEPNDFDAHLLYQRLRELAFLLPGVTIRFEDKRSSTDGVATEFYYPDGAAAYVRHLNRDYHTLHPPITVKETVPLKRDYQPLDFSADIEIAFQYADTQQPVLLGFVNTFDIERGGTHIRGLVEGLERAIDDYASQKRLVKSYWESFDEQDFICGLAAVIHIWHPLPKFDGATNRKLTSPELRDVVFHLVWKAVEAYAELHPDEMERIVQKCLANKARRLLRRYED